MRAPEAHLKGKQFFARFTESRPRALLLDYDGTLAPFRVQRDSAYPYPEVRRAVQGIIDAGRTRVVVISGRAIRDLTPLLNLTPLPELWGCHGWEHMTADGVYEGPEFSALCERALTRAKEWAAADGPRERCEIKPASVAIHWRGMTPTAATQLHSVAQAALEPLVVQSELELRSFDGGIELRAVGRDKAYAVRHVLRELDARAIVAYAGDDQTDEDAFAALSGRGLRILVRAELRETLADLWLRPPEELTTFLERWAAADMKGVSR